MCAREPSPPGAAVLRNLKKGFSGDSGVAVTLGTLRTLCESGQPTFGAGRPSDGSLGGAVVVRTAG